MTQESSKIQFTPAATGADIPFGGNDDSGLTIGFAPDQGESPAPVKPKASDALRKSHAPAAQKPPEKLVEEIINAHLGQQQHLFNPPPVEVKLFRGNIGGEGTYEILTPQHDLASAELTAANVPLGQISTGENKRFKLDTWTVPKDLAEERFTALTDAAAKGENLDKAARKLTYRQDGKDVSYAHYAKQLPDGRFEVMVRHKKNFDARALVVGVNKADRIHAERLQGAILYAPEKETNEKLQIPASSRDQTP